MPRSTCPLAFEMVVLGQSGGPTETELSGYILKAYETAWTDGWVGLEGGEFEDGWLGLDLVHGGATKADQGGSGLSLRFQEREWGL